MCVCVCGGGGGSVYQILTGECIVCFMSVTSVIMYHKCVCVWRGGGGCLCTRN